MQIKFKLGAFKMKARHVSAQQNILVKQEM